MYDNYIKQCDDDVTVESRIYAQFLISRFCNSKYEQCSLWSLFESRLSYHCTTFLFSISFENRTWITDFDLPAKGCGNKPPGWHWHWKQWVNGNISKKFTFPLLCTQMGKYDWLSKAVTIFVWALQGYREFFMTSEQSIIWISWYWNLVTQKIGCFQIMANFTVHSFLFRWLSHGQFSQ